MCLLKFEHVSIFNGIGFKKKLKAPTDHCFVLKVHFPDNFSDIIHRFHLAAILESVENKGFVFALSLHVQPHSE